MRTRLNPRLALRIGVVFAILLSMLAAALSLGFEAGAGSEWARQAVCALAVAALLTGVAVACFVTRSVARSTHDAAKVSERLDRVLRHVEAQDS